MHSKIVMSILLSTLILAAGSFVVIGNSFGAVTLLNPLTIPKWVNQITGPPPVYVPTNVTDKKSGILLEQDYTITVTSFMQQILPPGFPMTPVWGYGGLAKDAVTGAPLGFVRNSPAPSFEAIRGVPIKVTWVNNINIPFAFPVDPTLHWADPNNLGMVMPPFTPYPPGYAAAQGPVPLVTHLHGGEVQSYSDGGPDEWFTSDGKHGPGYSTVEKKTAPNAAVYYYPNEQQPTTLWYHDHALGVTRLTVMSGLAGFYPLREYDPALDPVEPLLPKGMYEVPLAIQDRIFNTDGTMFYDTVGVNPDVHPYWVPEFFGNTIMVNGLVWPNMNVAQGWYRFRLLDGSNARFYTLTLINQATNMLIPFYQIGSDQGYLVAPTMLTSLTLAPGERADILVDFSNVLPGTKILMRNNAKAPFPNGATADPRTVGQVMQFTVQGADGFQKNTALVGTLPTPLNPTLAVGGVPTYPTLTSGMVSYSRILTLWEVMGALGPLESLLNGQKWAGILSELPRNGATEDWMIVDLTGDSHPIHTHLTSFQLISRQKINVAKYTAAWLAAQQAALGDPTAMPPWPDNFTPVEVPIGPYLIGKPMLPPLNEQGWKDTVQMNPGEVTIIRIRFAQQDGSPYPFDPTVGPGYVWHCHILEHEDNEMMRPYKVVP